jgi:hypothetical protein
MIPVRARFVRSGRLSPSRSATGRGRKAGAAGLQVRRGKLDAVVGGEPDERRLEVAAVEPDDGTDPAAGVRTTEKQATFGVSADSRTDQPGRVRGLANG